MTSLPSTSERIQITYHREGQENQDFRAELAEALRETPRRLPSKYFYDTTGSELFEEITRLPEYYPTRVERSILETHADEIVAKSGACDLVELGSGAAVKTRILLDAMERHGCLGRYVPIDVSEAMVVRSAEELAQRYPQMKVHGVVGDFAATLAKVPSQGPHLAIFLGGTIGNLHPDDARGFLSQVARALDPSDHLLLGTDLIKDPAVIEAAYNDSAGVTAAFNLNILPVVNDLVDGDFDRQAFRHRAFFDPEHHRIEMRLVSVRDQTVRLDDLDLTLEIADGEELLTEISTKYDRPKVEGLLAGTGFELDTFYTDSESLFALSLCRRLDTLP